MDVFPIYMSHPLTCIHWSSKLFALILKQVEVGVSDTLEKILIIQERDQRIAKIQLQLADIPARREHVEFALRDQKAAVDTATDELKRIQVSIADQDGEVESRKTKILRYRQQQMDVKNNDEYRALNNEIFAEESAVKEMEDSEIRLMEQLETQKVVVAEKTAVLDVDREGIADDISLLDERCANLEEQLKALQDDRAAAAEGVDDEWLSTYERIMGNKKDSAVVAIQGSCCTGCFMNVTPQTIHHARHLDTITSCEFCGRLVYLKG